jgi:BirA family transcriptional regulator, biotin operon repressor / biotin---[acetyl-CoA-carboxylase] ligase
LYKIPANTLFLGKNLVYVPQCHSTNTLAAELSQNKEISEGTLVITDNQFAGRGQRGNSWEAAPSQNLTLSFVLKPRFLPAKDQFLINRVVSLGVSDYFREKVPSGTGVYIKWPNDIIINNKKAGGILIENHIHASTIQYSIAGIGLNINQEFFQHPKATSLRSITNKVHELNDELALLSGCLEVRYLDLKQNKINHLENGYLNILYRRNEIHRFRSNNEEWEGTIVGVDEVGRLRIRKNAEVKVFGVKEVSFL